MTEDRGLPVCGVTRPLGHMLRARPGNKREGWSLGSNLAPTDRGGRSQDPDGGGNAPGRRCQPCWQAEERVRTRDAMSEGMKRTFLFQSN